MRKVKFASLVVPVLIGMALPSSAAAQQSYYDAVARSECYIFRKTFNNPGKLTLCAAVAARVAANRQLDALDACYEARFSGRRRRGQRRSDLAACTIAVTNTARRVLSGA